MSAVFARVAMVADRAGMGMRMHVLMAVGVTVSGLAVRVFDRSPPALLA